MEFHLGGKTAVIHLPLSLLNDLGATADDLEGISAIPTSIEGVEVGIALKETRDGECHVSVRTLGGVNAAEVCRRFGGGGHIPAAGCTIQGSIEEAKKLMLEVLEPLLKYES